MTGTSSSARFIDSNVFVYAFAKPEVEVKGMKEKAREIVSRIERGRKG